jgi:translocation and assembly module TamB
LAIKTFEWMGKEGTRITAAGTLPLNWGAAAASAKQALAINASVNLPRATMVNSLLPERLISSGSIIGDAQVSGTWQRPLGNVHLDVKGVEWSDNQIWLPPGPFDLAGDLTYQGQNLILERLKLNSPTLSFEGSGLAADLPAVETLMKESLHNLGGSVVFRGTLNSSDISWVSSKVPALRRIEGRLQVDVDVKGSLPKPNLSLDLKLDEGELRSNADLPVMTALTLRAKATEKTVSIETFEGLLGGAAVRLKGSLNQILDPNPMVDLHLSGENLLLYRAQGVRIRGNTDLSLKGPLDELNLSGEIALSEGRISKYIDLLGILETSNSPRVDVGLQLFTIVDPPLRDMQFNVAVQAKQPVIVRNNVVTSEIIPDLRLRGSGQHPFLVGRIFVNNSRLRLPAGNLAFKAGLVQFTERNPDQPEVNLVGTTRMFGYDINVLVEGKYNEPVVTLSSLPPLSDSELVMLLLAGQPPASTNEANGIGDRLSRVAVFIGRDVLVRWFANDDVDSATEILDRFDVEVGRDITNRGEETLEASFRLADNLFNKGETLYITGEKDVYDYYNAGLRIVFRFK